MSNLNKTYHKGKYRGGEWAKHLRPYLKRLGNKKFRRIALNLEQDEFNRYVRAGQKKGKKNIKAKITIKLWGDSKFSYYKSYRTMKDLNNAVKRPKVIRYHLINEPNNPKHMFPIRFSGRSVNYDNISNINWETKLPNDNWCLILISNSNNEKLLDKIIEESITRNVGYICGIGLKHKYIHNQSDTEYITREIGESKLAKSKYHLVTVGDLSFEEGMWFGLNLTYNDEVEIKNIQIIDTDSKWENEIIELITKFKKGYVPEEEEQTGVNK